MNIKHIMLSAVAALGFSGVALAQSPIGNPFAGLGIEFYGFFLPWIFVFAVVYGLLLKLGTFPKNINGAIALVVAFFASAVGGVQLAGFFTALFGGASMFLAGILVIMLFAMMIGVKIEKGKQTVALIIVVLIGAGLFLASSGNFLAVSVIGPDFASMVFWIIIIIAAFYLVTSKGDDGGEHH